MDYNVACRIAHSLETIANELKKINAREEKKEKIKEQNALATPTSIGKRIRDLRNSHNLSSVELAEKIGCTPQAITSIERGVTKNPSMTICHAIAKVFNIYLDDLIEEEVTP